MEAQVQLLLGAVDPEVLAAEEAEAHQPQVIGVEAVVFLVAAAPMAIKLMLAMADAEAEAGVAVAHP